MNGHPELNDPDDADDDRPYLDDDEIKYEYAKSYWEIDLSSPYRYGLTIEEVADLDQCEPWETVGDIQRGYLPLIPILGPRRVSVVSAQNYVNKMNRDPARITDVDLPNKEWFTARDVAAILGTSPGFVDLSYRRLFWHGDDESVAWEAMKWVPWPHTAELIPLWHLYLLLDLPERAREVAPATISQQWMKEHLLDVDPHDDFEVDQLDIDE
jgi:hypothetical protein